MEIVYLKLSDIHPYENNPRVNDQAVDKVAASITAFKFGSPIIVDGDHVIICGHTRYKAAEKLGLDTVPCIVRDDLTEEEVRAYRIADNRTGEYAEWDYEKLAAELAQIPDIAMEDFGEFTLEELNNEPEPQAFDDNFDLEAVEAEIQEPITQPGDVWKLGRHRLVCGNSTSVTDVKKLTDGQLIDLFVTDPPYNVDYEGTAGKIQNDNMSDRAFLGFLTDAFRAADQVIKPGAAFYIWHADSEGLNFRRACEATGWRVRQCLIWNKNSLVLGRQDYQWKHEPCLYGWKNGAAHYFTDSRSETTVLEDRPNINAMSKDELKQYIKDIWNSQTATTVIDCDRPSRSEEHPTMKPVNLIAYQISNSSKKGGKVLDLFGGSGTTLIACEQLQRDCFMMELDPHFCDVIVKRWEKLTGQQAELLRYWHVPSAVLTLINKDSAFVAAANAKGWYFST